MSFWKGLVYIMSFKKINLSDLTFNPFTLIGKDWMLITSGSPSAFNTMTASWGQLGKLWNKDVFTCYIRSNRFTYEFIENNSCFTASFFGEQHRDALSYCGSHSGRDCNKAENAGLTPTELDGCTAFEEADMVFVCRKLYKDAIKRDSFLTSDSLDDKFYSNDPYHAQYISEIVAVYVKEK